MTVKVNIMEVRFLVGYYACCEGVKDGLIQSLNASKVFVVYTELHLVAILQPSDSRVHLSSGKVGFLSKKQTAIRASLRPFDSDSSSGPIAPLRMESPIGQFLSEILVRHPHLLPAAVDKQLEQLQTDRNAESEKDKPSASGTELVLYR